MFQKGLNILKNLGHLMLSNYNKVCETKAS